MKNWSSRVQAIRNILRHFQTFRITGNPPDIPTEEKHKDST
jgi:hypothetical protein